MKIKNAVFAFVLAACLSEAAQAGLQARDLDGNTSTTEAYYDTDLNITWLADANANGARPWMDANTWAANLSIVDAINNITYDNWRLPISDTCGGYNCTGSEMGHLYYVELGGVAEARLEQDKFTGLGGLYWSGTEFNGAAWYFAFDGGGQSKNGNSDRFAALAVSPGDVGIAPIPEPETYAMMLAGLGLLGVMARRRKQKS